MNEAKHTPGPWFTHREGFSSVYIEARIGGGMLQEVASCGPTNEGSDQQEANAHLIAAAPELLEALKVMIEAEHPYEGGGYSSEELAALEKAHAAIAKATGRADSGQAAQGGGGEHD